MLHEARADMSYQELNTDLIAIVVSRIDNLENMLGMSSLAMIVTTTLGVVGALYTIQKERGPGMAPTTLFIGINALFVFITGYDYYILTQYYATLSLLGELLKTVETSAIRNFVEYYQASVFFNPGTGVRFQLYIYTTLLFPFFFAISVSFIAWSMLKNDMKNRFLRKTLFPASVAIHMATLYVMGWNSCATFIELVLDTAQVGG